MSQPPKNDPYEALEEELDPHRREELERAMQETRVRLRGLGISLSGRESSEELVNLLEAVERFERAVEARGGDLMVDEGPRGETREPDDVHFVLPRRGTSESVASYLGRLDAATDALRHHRPHRP
jgi:hypothetical protein